MLVQRLTRNVNYDISSYNTLLALERALLGRVISIRTTIKRNMLVAIGQMRSTKDKNGNLQQVKQLVQKAKEKSAKFLFLPECCDFIAENRQETIELAEPLTGSTVAAYCELAKRNAVWLSLGGIHQSILSPAGDKTKKIYNAHVIIDSYGDIVKVYRKLHLFDTVFPEFRFLESDVVEKGDRLVPPLQTPIGRLGLQVCYDMRFQEVAAALRKLGAEILTYPAAFTTTTGKAHWEVLIRARAIENQCYVVAPAQTGFHNRKRQSYGHALIVDPWGHIVADAEQRELDVSTATIDLEKLAKIRQKMPCFEHRRNDVYSLTAIEASDLENVDREFSTLIIPKSTIFFESPHCFAFTNLRSIVKGHVLVSTKRVVPRLKNLNCDEMSDLFSTACKVQTILEGVYNTKAATITIQDGPDAGQSIKHVHLHILARRPGDICQNDNVNVDPKKLPNTTRNMDEMVTEARIYRDYIARSRLK